MSRMILRPKGDGWVLYPSDRRSEREFFDTEAQARKFAAQHYRGIEVIIPRRQRREVDPSVFPPHEGAGLTLGYYFARAMAKRAGGAAR